MVLTKIPPQAQWKRFKQTWKSPQNDAPPEIREFSGWLIKEDEHSYWLLDLFGAERNLSRDQTVLSPRLLKDDADEIATIRASGDSQKIMESLSVQGGLTGQFQSYFVSVPEALLAAWSLEREDRATAAKLIFPCYSLAENQVWVKQAIRDMMGASYHDKMLHAFSYARDYPESIRIADHLSRPVFEGYEYQDRAKELKHQLASRSDDFSKFVLPTPAEWVELKSNSTRVKQIDYLAARIRLLNCFQWGQPGGVRYEDPQFREASQGATAGRERTPVINPTEELNAMKLEVRDLPALVPYVSDEDFMPTYSYWRNFHPARTLHRVSWVVADILNAAAKHQLVDLNTFESLDAEGKKQYVQRVSQWVAANADKSARQLLLETLQSSDKFSEFSTAAGELIAAKDRTALPILMNRFHDFEANRGEIAAMCYHLDPQGSLSSARRMDKGFRRGDTLLGGTCPSAQRRSHENGRPVRSSLAAWKGYGRAVFPRRI